MEALVLWSAADVLVGVVTHQVLGMRTRPHARTHAHTHCCSCYTSRRVLMTHGPCSGCVLLLQVDAVCQ